MHVPLTTNGLVPAPEFPAESYEAIHRHVVSRWATHILYEHYAGAWSAVAYRFHSAMHACDEFETSIISYGSMPSPEDRYNQDQALSAFFSSGFSAFESVFYSLHTVGAFIDPSRFSLATSKAQQQVSPSQTTAAFKRAFSGDPILLAFESLFEDPAYQELREIRNVLTHRTAPGRRMYVGIGSDDAPETEWKLKNIRLDRSMARSRRYELARLLATLLISMETFVSKKAEMSA